MQSYLKTILRAGCLAAVAVVAAPAAGIAGDELLYISTGEQTRPPIGWVEFCARGLPKECEGSNA